MSFRVGLSAVEAARGEVTHYLVTGNENRPDRWRVRAPTYPNLQGVPLMLRNQQIADVPITIGSIDPCYSCTDRMEIVDADSGRMEVVTREQIDQWSREGRRGK